MNRPRFGVGLVALAAIAWAGCAPHDGQPAPVAGQASSGSDVDSDEDSASPLDLAEACSQTAEYWRRQLDRHALASPPFVLAGTMDAAALRAWSEETVRPAAFALGRQYFDRPPSRPITILLFADEATYRAEAERLFGDRAISRHGYYRPHLNTVLVNVADGPSSLLHELVHALMAFDFPEAPAWLREGLATLYEDCRVDAGSGALVPQAGARRTTLDDALRQGRLPSLKSLLQKAQFNGPDRPVYYALARHFCLYLTRQGKMASVYRAVRDAGSGDSDAMAALLGALECDSWATLEADFRRWAAPPE
ncbi:MAG: hypothetical protein U1E05_10860 [Patescibacteria group bacterium]|nr:hypothetical protein [Patescibacteria group bacterium]